MKNLSKLFIVLFTTSCASVHVAKIRPGVSTYSYKDSAGLFYLKRYLKKSETKVITKSVIFSPGKESKPLEKSITVSSIVSNQKKTRLRPSISQFNVWFEKKKHISQHKINSETKSLDTIINDPIKKINKKISTRFPKSDSFCFFSQMAECFQYLQVFGKQIGYNKSFYVVWDSYPFHHDQYSAITKDLFSSAFVRREENRKNLIRYSVELNGQLIFIEFNQSYQLENLFWIAQGITIQRLRG